MGAARKMAMRMRMKAQAATAKKAPESEREGYGTDEGGQRAPAKPDGLADEEREASGGAPAPVLELAGVRYTYSAKGRGGGNRVLAGVNASFSAGEVHAIVGPSGCGKSTLLSLLGGLDVPDEGEVRVNGVPLREADLAAHRRHAVAFVFQSYNLIDYLTAAENVALATRLPAAPLLERVGIDGRMARRSVLALSGGQQQRVAIARALGSEARILLADEPTGSLDEDTAREIAALLVEAAHRDGRCVIVVTHSRDLAAKADTVLRLKRGKLLRER